MNNYYVYIYLDPRKSGKYRYDKCEFEYEPFYIGKGKGNRWKRTHNRRNNYFKNKINKIKECGFELLVVKLCENLSEEKSFLLESELIDIIGRKDLNKGPLVNFTDGGEGTSGIIITEEIKNKKSGKNNHMFGKHHSEETRRKMSESHLGKKHSEESKKLISKNHRNTKGPNNPMYGKYHSEKSINKIKCSIGLNRIGEKNSNSKLTENDVILIKMALREFKDITQKELSKIFNIKPDIISEIKTGKTWSHIK